MDHNRNAEDTAALAGRPSAASTRAFGPLRLLVSPRIRRSGREVVARLHTALADRGVAHEVVDAAGRSLEELAGAALDEGVRYLAAVGDDGAVHDVLNGMFPDGRPATPDAVLAVVGMGPGCDFARNFGLDRPPEVIARHLSTDHEMAVDVGTAEFRRSDGAEGRRVFANVAQVGYGAERVRRRAGLPRSLGRVGDLVAAYGAITGIHRQDTEVSVDHTSPVLPVVNVVVANGQFYSDGSKVAPRALADDGRFNVQVFTGQRSQVFLLTQRIFRGEHLPDPDIAEWQSATVSLAPADPLAVEADGRFLGRTPAQFGLLVRALRLKI